MKVTIRAVDAGGNTLADDVSFDGPKAYAALDALRVNPAGKRDGAIPMRECLLRAWAQAEMHRRHGPMPFTAALCDPVRGVEFVELTGEEAVATVRELELFVFQAGFRKAKRIIWTTE
jgi:hypothetical protein